MKLVAFVSLLLLSLPLSSKEKSLKVSLIDWCPHICPGEKTSGYVYDVFEKIFKNSDYDIKYSFFPLKRALDNVKSGSYDVLLSPSKSEAPELIFHEEPLSTQHYCLVKSKGEKETENSKYLLFYGISPKVKELLKNKNTTYVSYDKHYFTRVTKLLSIKRYFSFVMTFNEARKFLRDSNLSNKFEIYDCLFSEPIWVGISPVDKEKGKFIAKEIDERLRKIKKSGVYKNVLKKYDITEPSKEQLYKK